MLFNFGGEAPPPPVVVSDAFPRERHHGWKFIRFGPDGLLYLPVGAPCNVCEPPGRYHETILRMRPDGSNFKIFAFGNVSSFFRSVCRILESFRQNATVFRRIDRENI